MRASRVAWAVAGVCLALAVLDTLLVAASYPPFSSKSLGIHGWPLVNLAGVGSAVLGAVILGSQPRQPIGWILSLIGLTTSISLVTESYGIWALQYDGPGTSQQGHLSGWVAALLGGPLALALLSGVLLLVPAGTYLSPRWRWVACTAWVGYAFFVLGLVLIGPSGINRSGDPIDAGLVARALLSSGVVLITAMLLASVVGMLRRLRRSTGVARQQLRVVATGAASVGLALVTLIVGQGFNGGRQSWWSSVPLYLSYLFLVVCIAVAVLRYRLYDAEIIVSRAVALALATAFVAIGYIGLVVGLGRTMESSTDGGFWWSLLAMVVVALAFQPLRRWVVRVADRAAYGSRAAPYDALADFSRRIGRGPAGGELLPTIAAAAGEAVRADLAVVRLDGEPDARLRATWPSDVAEPSVVPSDRDVVVPIADAAGRLGSVTVRLPPGRDVRPPARRLLVDIADQAGLALRNARLQIERAARVRQLDRRTRELTASRNRIVGAVDTERRRLESSLAARVLPTMGRLRAEVEGCAVGEVRADGIAACVDLATEALESLRELTRGIYPTILTRSGIAPALSSYAGRTQRSDGLRIGPSVAAARFPERIEAAAYFCCVEVLEDAHGDAALELSDDGRELLVTLHGVTTDALRRWAIVDRVEACGGTLDVRDDDHRSLDIRFPVGPSADPRTTTPPPTDRG